MCVCCVCACVVCVCVCCVCVLRECVCYMCVHVFGYTCVSVHVCMCAHVYYKYWQNNQMKLADENICTLYTLFGQLMTQVWFPFEWTGTVGRHAGRQHSQAAACGSPEECWPFSPGRSNPPACSNTPPVAPGSSPARSTSPLAAWKHRHIKSEIIPTLCIIRHCLLPETTDKPNLKLFLPCTYYVTACCQKWHARQIWELFLPCM